MGCEWTPTHLKGSVFWGRWSWGWTHSRYLERASRSVLLIMWWWLSNVLNVHVNLMKESKFKLIFQRDSSRVHAEYANRLAIGERLRVFRSWLEPLVVEESGLECWCAVQLSLYPNSFHLISWTGERTTQHKRTRNSIQSLRGLQKCSYSHFQFIAFFALFFWQSAIGNHYLRVPCLFSTKTEWMKRFSRVGDVTEAFKPKSNPTGSRWWKWW